MPPLVRLAHVATFTMGCLVAVVTFAQDTTQSCNDDYRQCTSGCRIAGLLGRQAAQVCSNTCADHQRSCMSGAAAARRAPAAAAAPPVPADRAPGDARDNAPTQSPKVAEATASTWVAPSSFDFEGPIRFAPRYARSFESRDKPTPLVEERKGKKVGEILSGRDSLERVRNNPMDPLLRANLKAEYAALEQAGFTTLECSYGPTVVGSGYTSEYFWLDKRPSLSAAMLELNSKYKGIDVALAHCPNTLGLAMDIAAGIVEAPSPATQLAAETAFKARTGQRYVPTIATVKNFDDARPLDASVLLPVSSVTADRPVVPRESWSQNPTALGEAILQLEDQGQQVLLCRYAHEVAWSAGRTPDDPDAFSPAAENVSANGLSNNVLLNDVRFWSLRRPAEFKAEFFEQLNRMAYGKLNFVDVAADRCPSRYGAALALIDGSPEALAAGRKAGGAFDPSGATRNSDARDRELAKTVDDAIASLEGASTILPSGFRDVVQTRVQPALTQLAGSAYVRVQDIPVGAAGRKRFDAWDEAYGGRVMDAIRRLYVIARKKTFRIESSGVTVADLTSKRGAIESESSRWAQAAQAQVFTRPIYQAYVKIYDVHLAEQPLLDPAFMQRVAKDVEAANATAQRNESQRADALRPNFINRSEIVFGTPSEIAAYRFRTQLLDGAGNAAMGIASARRSFAEADAETRRFRTAFWSCYEKRCSEAATRYADYSLVLKNKDTLYLVMPSVTAVNEQAMLGKTGKPSAINQIMTYLGAGSVDDGIVLGCEGPARRFSTALVKRLLEQGGIVAQAQADTAFVGESTSPDYLEWQKCRDRMEYVFRRR